MNLPGGQMARRPLHFIWICDCSGSMSVNGKIQTLNNAIRQSIPLMREAAADNPNVEVLVRVIVFSDGAQWQVAQPVPVENFEWTDLNADGVTDLGKALSMVAEQLKVPPMTNRALPPVLVLITDGQPTDDFGSGLKALMEQFWGKKSVRIAIAVGQDAEREVLQRFIGNPELKPLDANNPDALIARIKWVSTELVNQVSQPVKNQEGGVPDVNWVNLPTAQDMNAGSNETEIW
jgi:uncharacterized protein YegL